MLKLNDSDLGYNWVRFNELGHNSAFRINSYCPVCGIQLYFHFTYQETIDRLIKNREDMRLHCKGCDIGNIPLILNKHMKVEEYTNGG